MVFRQSLGRIWRRGRATQREHGEKEGGKGRLNIQSYCDSRKANKVLPTCFLRLIKLALLTKGLVLAGPKRRQGHTLKQPPLEQSRSNLQKQEKVTLWGSQHQKQSHLSIYFSTQYHRESQIKDNKTFSIPRLHFISKFPAPRLIPPIRLSASKQEQLEVSVP